MSEGAPKPERYKSRWDEEGNFIWKDGVSFSLSEQKGRYTLKVFNEVNGVSVQAGEAELNTIYDGEVFRSFYIESFKCSIENEGNAANLIECVNSFLDYQNKSGSLSNYIGLMREGPVSGGQNLLDNQKNNLYANHGWEKARASRDMYRQPKKGS